MDRRESLRAACAIAAALASRHAMASVSEAGKEEAERRHLEVMERYRSIWDGPMLEIGLLVYPGMFLQDLVGPLTMFEALLKRRIHLLWKTLDPVGPEKPDHPGLPVLPTTRFADCPERLDVLFVPGGVPGTLTMMEDQTVLDFLADRGGRAAWVTSVCTGSLILGAAGLLRGYRATSHWVTVDVLRDLGATPVRSRVVVDRNRMTGGGVTAGLDFGLDLIGRLRSPAYAKAVQLYLEYDPRPPYNAGRPDRAPRETLGFISEMFAGMVEASRAAARRTASQRGFGRG